MPRNVRRRNSEGPPSRAVAVAAYPDGMRSESASGAPSLKPRTPRRLGFRFGWALGRRCARGLRSGAVGIEYVNSMRAILLTESVRAVFAFQLAITVSPL